MVDIWGSIKETAKSLGGVPMAPVGAVWDLAQMPFDDEDDDFGTILAALSKRGQQGLDPVLNPQTLTGAAVHKFGEGATWAAENILSEPISTFAMTTQHVAQDDVPLSALFDGDTWAEGYKKAQGVSAGQALAFGLLDSDKDPFDYKDPYEESTAKEHTILGPSLSFGMNVAGAWFLDPFVLAGKGASVLRSQSQFHKLSQGEKANLFSEITAGSRSGALKGNPQSRTDKYLDWIGGNNGLKRPLEGPEILHGTPELKRYVAEPHVIAGLLADANKFDDPILRRDAQRRILAVAGGDASQISRLRSEVAESGAIADSLDNLLKGGTLDLKRLAADTTLQHKPEFIAHLERQLDNLNDRQSIDKFMDGWNARLQQVLETQHTMTHLPGVHNAGKRAIKRQNETGALRSLDNAHKQVDEWTAKQWSTAQSLPSLYQRSMHTVPLVAVKTVGLAASPWTKLPVRVSDPLRQAHFTGIANLHDWGGSATQLDSMMRLSKVSAGDRMKALSEIYLAKTEPEKMRIIERIESLSMHSMAGEFSAKYGREIDRGYIETLMTEHSARRGLSLANLRGRSYAATEMPDALRAQSAGRIEDAAMGGKGFTAQQQGKWRVDHINDDGTPLALPLLETQLSNSVPLLDMGVARTLLERDHSYLARLSRTWADDSKELARLSGLKSAGHQGLDKAIATKAASVDWLVNAGQKAMRVWKFGVLFRVGYPMRVVMDDHWRIWSQMGAGTFYGDNGRELISNLRHNKWDRKLTARKDLHDLKVRRREILDELDGDRMVTHLERQSDLRMAERSASAYEREVAKLRSQLDEAETKRSLGVQTDTRSIKQRLEAAEREAVDKRGHATYLHEQLGDYGPDELKRELEGIDGVLEKGMKGLMPEKRRVGSRDVVLDKETGDTIEGAFGGLHGASLREASSSSATFETQLQGVEDRMYSAGTRGSHRTIQHDEPGHLDAWADVLNYQFRNSPVAMHFVKGGDIESFTRWIKKPEQAELRQRLPHFAHDPEDWGGRVQALVWDYIPSDALRESVIGGRVSARQLGKMFADQSFRPAVHGRVVADNIGTSAVSLGVGKTVNRLYRFIGEMPTDRLSRHPFFSSLYKQHAKDVYGVKRLSNGGKFSPRDLDDIQGTARRMALNDLKRTLFDISAHSHGAHVMRFVSPFFAAHQESIARWWRIVGDDPSIVRRFTQAFDVPRHLGLVVDDEGDLVEPGAPISREHRLLLQLPKAFGGPDSTEVQSKWSISENSFNLILQGGLTNPGAGPIVSVPVEYFAQKYADEKEIARMARVFNPFPPQSPMEAAIPATLKRLSALTYGMTGYDPSLGLGIGMREYNTAYSQNVQDAMVQFNLTHGREPSRREAQDIMLRAGRESTTQMFHRFLWNAGTPAPAQARSKYAVVQQGWYKIVQQAQAEGKDFDWAYAQFKSKWGEAYMPLVYSSSNNPANVDATSGAVAALKRYKGVLSVVDPQLTRAVIGAYNDDLIEANASMGEYSPEARNFLRSEQIRPGSPDTYYNYDDPRTAMEEQMTRRGWQKYGELTAGLTAMAQEMGLDSYMDSDKLTEIKRLAIAQLREENWAFDQDYGQFDSTEYDRYLDDMRTIVATPALADDAERTDIQTLKTYLAVRDAFTTILEARKQAGFGGPDAQDQAPLRAVYSKLVGQLVESNTYFETHIFNGLVERDPLLTEAA